MIDTEEGNIMVTARYTKSSFELTISDTGVGIPGTYFRSLDTVLRCIYALEYLADDLGKVFERFHRVEVRRSILVC